MRVVRSTCGYRMSKDVYKRQKNYLDPKIFVDMERPYSQKRSKMVKSRKRAENRPPTNGEKIKLRHPELK